MWRQDLQPYSRQAWEERRRQFAIEQEQIKRRRSRTLVLAVSLVAVIVAVWVYVVSPGDWKGKAGSYARELVKQGTR